MQSPPSGLVIVCRIDAAILLRARTPRLRRLALSPFALADLEVVLANESRGEERRIRASLAFGDEERARAACSRDRRCWPSSDDAAPRASALCWALAVKLPEKLRPCRACRSTPRDGSRCAVGASRVRGSSRRSPSATRGTRSRAARGGASFEPGPGLRAVPALPRVRGSRARRAPQCGPDHPKPVEPEPENDDEEHVAHDRAAADVLEPVDRDGRRERVAPYKTTSTSTRNSSIARRYKDVCRKNATE